MIMKFIPKIKSNITIYSTKKTTNILDGSYRSIYRGKTMNFEDLREYVVGDNIKDIDWKASSRSNNLLVRQYIAEKKHNIFFVFDSGKKVMGDTLKLETKKNVMIMCAGIIAYLANKNGDYVGAIYSQDSDIRFFPFKSSLYNIETILSNYDNNVKQSNESNMEKTLQYITKNLKRKTIMFIITDIDGMDKLDENELKKLKLQHDILVINVSDSEIFGSLAYDIDNEQYFPKMILEDKKLAEIEKKEKEKVLANCEKKFKKYGIPFVTIDSSKESVIKIIELLERYKNASIS